MSSIKMTKDDKAKLKDLIEHDLKALDKYNVEFADGLLKSISKKYTHYINNYFINKTIERFFDEFKQSVEYQKIVLNMSKEQIEKLISQFKELKARKN